MNNWDKILMLILLPVMGWSSYAQKKTVIQPFTIESAYEKLKKNYPFIKPIEPVEFKDVTAMEDRVYHEVDGYKLRADIYIPGKGDHHPGVLLIHGGGWVSGSKENLRIMGQYLAKEGYVAVVANYRLSGEAKFPAAVHDLKAALTWVRSNKAEFRVDPDRIAVLGTSAGAQLATLLGVSQGDNAFIHKQNKYQDKVAAIVNIDGIVSFIHPEAREGTIAGLWLDGLQDENPLNWKKASPLEYVDENTPPVLFINSAQPRFHAGRDDMLKIINEHQIFSEVHTIPESPHSFWLMHPWFNQTLEYTVNFLNNILKTDTKQPPQ